MLEETKNHHRRVLEGISRLETRLPFRVAVLSRLLDRSIGRILAEHDLTLAPFRILVTIDAFGEMSAADLTRYVVVDKALISRRTADLVKKGYVASRTDPKDPRRKILSLTDAGIAKLDALKPAVDRRQEELEAQLSSEERRAFAMALEKLSNHLAAKLDRS